MIFVITAVEKEAYEYRVVVDAVVDCTEEAAKELCDKLTKESDYWDYDYEEFEIEKVEDVAKRIKKEFFP